MTTPSVSTTTSPAQNRHLNEQQKAVGPSRASGTTGPPSSDDALPGRLTLRPGRGGCLGWGDMPRAHCPDARRCQDTQPVRGPVKADRCEQTSAAPPELGEDD